MQLYLSGKPAERTGRGNMIEPPISCEHAVARLTDYLDAALSPTEYDAIQDHLDTCPNCSKTLEELKLTISLLAQLRQR